MVTTCTLWREPYVFIAGIFVFNWTVERFSWLKVNWDCSERCQCFFSLLHCQIVAPRGNEIYPAGFETTWPKLKTVKLQLTNACNASFVFISFNFFFCYWKKCMFCLVYIIKELFCFYTHCSIICQKTERRKTLALPCHQVRWQRNLVIHRSG